MLNIVVPMAGRGSRFANQGYSLPKPLIEVRGTPMIQVAMSNLIPEQDHRFVFLCLNEHLENLPTESYLRQICPNCEIVPVEGVTQGAACTVLLAKEFIDSDDALMIVNSDQWVDIEINDYLSKMDQQQADGLIMTMTANDAKWSYIRQSPTGEITEVVEKEVVSSEATVGIYNFRRGSEFVAAAEDMIARNLRVNNEFYVAPTYNMLIEQGKRLAYYNIGSEGNGMHGLGIPSDLNAFLGSPACDKAMELVGQQIDRIQAA
ncbi:glycosyltransferase family 2 protein [Bremerella sp. JC770]|uniref:glycosyltransferase family 2 protein n=1 Tax=Bremerella sp. JC770 TaxID=3232137 RepID=UPI00345871C4